MVEYFWGRVFEGIWGYWVNTKSPHILTSLGGENTGEVNNAWRVFNLAKNTLEWRGFVGISRDYPLKTRTSKQPIGEVLGYEIILSHSLKYPRSKQALTDGRKTPLVHNHSACTNSQLWKFGAQFCVCVCVFSPLIGRFFFSDIYEKLFFVNDLRTIQSNCWDLCADKQCGFYRTAINVH
jgi:hypothetical protein